MSTAPETTRESRSSRFSVKARTLTYTTGRQAPMGSPVKMGPVKMGQAYLGATTNTATLRDAR